MSVYGCVGGADFDARELVEELSREGKLIDVLKEACSLYGMELHLDDDVQFRLNAKTTTGAKS